MNKEQRKKAKEKKKNNLFSNLFHRQEPEAPKQRYYDRTKLDETNAVYRIAIGARGNGKTYSWCDSILDHYFETGEASAYVRRYDEEIAPKNASALFRPHTQKIIELSGGRFNDVQYRAKEFRLCYTDDEGHIVDKDPNPFCFTAAVNTWMTQKGQDRGTVWSLLYDEFLTRDGYLKNEFVDFMNVVSSFVRDRDNAIIYMFANTVSKFSPYWEELGIKSIETMEQGDIRVYQYGNSDLSVAIEYCPDVAATDKVASKYFAFDNPQLAMISNGKWEIMAYEHLTHSLDLDKVLFNAYIEFDGKVLCMNVVLNGTELYGFIHPQTKEVKYTTTSILYTSRATLERCHVHFLKDCPTRAHEIVKNLILKKALFFATNECGETFRAWLINEQGIKGLY